MIFGFSKDGLQAFFRWAFYIFIVLFPFVLYQGAIFNGTSTRSVNTLVFVEVLAVVFGFALLDTKKRLSVIKSPITLTLALLLLSMLVSSLFGVDWHTSLWSKATRTTGLYYFLHVAVLYFFYWFAFDEKKTQRTFIGTFIISAAIFSIGAALSNDGFKLIYTAKPWAGFTIGNSTFAGMYLYAAFMLSIYFLMTAQKKSWWKYLLPVAIFLNPYLLNFDLFRGTLNILKHPTQVIGSAEASSVTLIVSIIALFLFWLVYKVVASVQTRKGILYGSVLAAIVILGFASASLLTPGGVVQKAYLSQSSAARPIIWEATKGGIKERPLFGWGVDNFERVYLKYFNTSVLEEKNGGEAWFDRAHNILIDQTIETGYVGVSIYILVYLVIIFCLVYVLVKTKDKEDQVLGVVLLVYYFGHFLEIQTAFDTTISYIPLIIITAMSAMLFYRTRVAEKKGSYQLTLPIWSQYVKAVSFIVAFSILFFAVTVPIINVQHANGAIRRAGSSAKRIPYYSVLFTANKLDEAAFLWRTSSDVQRGISLKPSVLEDPKQRQGLIEEFDVMTKAYQEYLAKNPHDYRILLNLADVYIYQRLFDIDHLDQAHVVLDQAERELPQSPQPYWMHAVAYLYQHKFTEAKQAAQKAYDLNPGVEESKRVLDYINKSIPAFPVIDLYSFKQI